MNLEIKELRNITPLKNENEIFKKLPENASLTEAIVEDKDSGKKYSIFVSIVFEEDKENDKRKLILEGYYDIDTKDKEVVEQVAQWTLKQIKADLENWIKNELEKMKEEENESKPI